MSEKAYVSKASLNIPDLMENQDQAPRRHSYNLRSLRAQQYEATKNETKEAVSLTEAQIRDRPDLEFGGKVFLSEDVLTEKVGFFEDDWEQQPLLFKLEREDKEEVFLHCGVWEFTAEEGQVQIPEWMMDRLGGRRVKVTSVRLPKARSLTVRPVTDPNHSHNLMNLPNLKSVLEMRLKAFSALTVNDVVPIEFDGRVYLMEVVAATPSHAVDITETNVEIDFALSAEEETELKNRMDEQYWTHWQPGQGLRFFRGERS